MACVAIIATGVIVVVKISKKPANNQQLINLFTQLANELKEVNKEMRGELSELTEKVSSIEKILKEVE